MTLAVGKHLITTVGNHNRLSHRVEKAPLQGYRQCQRTMITDVDNNQGHHQ